MKNFIFIINNLNSIGLVFNLIGTILLALYVSKDPSSWEEGEEGQKNGEKWHYVYIKKPYRLRLGLILLGFGFLLSFIDSL